MILGSMYSGFYAPYMVARPVYPDTLRGRLALYFDYAADNALRMQIEQALNMEHAFVAEDELKTLRLGAAIELLSPALEANLQYERRAILTMTAIITWSMTSCALAATTVVAPVVPFLAISFGVASILTSMLHQLMTPYEEALEKIETDAKADLAKLHDTYVSESATRTSSAQMRR